MTQASGQPAFHYFPNVISVSPVVAYQHSGASDCGIEEEQKPGRCSWGCCGVELEVGGGWDRGAHILHPQRRSTACMAQGDDGPGHHATKNCLRKYSNSCHTKQDERKVKGMQLLDFSDAKSCMPGTAQEKDILCMAEGINAAGCALN